MTTKVTITNDGIRPIYVLLQDRFGGFNGVKEDAWLETKFRGPPLFPGESREVYLWGDRRVVIEEVDHDIAG